MRKTITTIIVTIIMLSLIYVSCWYESHYTREATVIEVTDNIVTVVDDTNNLWSFEGTNFNVNDKVKMTMDSMNTDLNIYDDEITNVKKN